MTEFDSIREAWSRETSFWPDRWSPEQPETGQCAVTALAVQARVGGDIWRGLAGYEPHYWNRAGGQTIDLTLAQFEPGTQVKRDVPVHRDVLLRDEDTARRYALLCSHMTTAVLTTGKATSSPIGQNDQPGLTVSDAGEP